MKKKVLAVDNDRFLLEFMKDVLPPEKYQVFTAKDGLEALDVMDETRLDIIFVDLVMPNIGGERLCKIIRGMKKFKDAFVVVLSSVVAEKQIDLKNLGVNACIAKGTIEKMAKNIQSVLENPENAAARCARGEVIGAEKYVQRKITHELIHLGKHCESILEVMHDGVLEVVPTGRIIYVNPVCNSLLGIPENMLLGSDFFRLLSEKDRPRIYAACRDAREKDDACGEHRLNINDHELMLRVLPVSNENCESLIIMIKDITEKRRMEEKLTQAEKMEALGILAGGIAHNFNNLLTAINGNLSLLMMEEGLEHEHLYYLKQIENCVNSGSALTCELLKLARGETQKLNSVDLNHIVQASSEIFRVTDRHIQIHRNLQDDLWIVDADAGQLEQVLLNLYVNAQQAMPQGGEIFLETRNVTREENVEKSLKKIERKYVKISVRDTGRGIEEKDQEKIFDPFFTTKKLGSGLGLSTARNTLANHKGTISVKNSDEGGAKFEILIPASENQPVRENFSIEKKKLADTSFVSWKKHGRLRVASGY